MAANRQTYRHTHARAQCSHASVGLAQARPNNKMLTSNWHSTGRLVVVVGANTDNEIHSSKIITVVKSKICHVCTETSCQHTPTTSSSIQTIYDTQREQLQIQTWKINHSIKI